MKKSPGKREPCSKKAHDERLAEGRERDVDFRDFLLAGEALLVNLERVQRGAVEPERTNLKNLRESIRDLIRNPLKPLCGKTMIREF